MLHMSSETNSPAAVVRSGMVRMLMHVGSMCDCFGLQDAFWGWCGRGALHVSETGKVRRVTELCRRHQAW